jgi:uncharacterized protein (DUF3084 family)
LAEGGAPALGTLAAMPDRPKLESKVENGSERQQELDDRDQEIQRLRNLLVTRDAELGEARGRLTEMESYMGLLSRIATRLQEFAPALARLAGAALRRLQGRSRREGD